MSIVSYPDPNVRIIAVIFIFTSDGGGQNTKWKTPSPNFEELIESITNMLFFFLGGSRKKSYKVSKLGGGGGGGGVLGKKIFLKKFFS